MIALSDEELVERCKKELPDNTRSYEILVSRHMQRVYGMIYRVVRQSEEAEDITQEVFLKVFHHLRTFDQKASFTSWLYRVTTNAALDALDKIKRRPVSAPPKTARPDQYSQQEENEFSDPSHPSSGQDPVAETVINAELRECIYRILRRLERDHASVILMRDFYDMAYDEIAHQLQSSLSAVKMRIHRARLAFQELFARLCEGRTPPPASAHANPRGKVR